MTKPEEIAPGLTWFTRGCNAVWRGTAEALIAAGRVQAHQLPGAPGNGVTMSSYRRDGTKRHTGPKRPQPGDFTIAALPRKSGTLYEVRVRLPSKPSQAAMSRKRAQTVLPPQATQDAIETLLDDLRKLDGSINNLAKLPAPAPRVSAPSLKRIRDARSMLGATIAAADWEVA